MNRLISKNPAYIGVVMVIISVLMGITIGVILELLNLEFNTSSFVAGVVAATIIGQLYAGRYAEVMPKKLAKQSTLIYILIESVFAGLFFLYTGILQDEPGLMLAGVLGFGAIVYIIFPWLIRKGGENYLKAQEKARKKKAESE